jgi:nitrogen fixation-related uncharacterized protein
MGMFDWQYEDPTSSSTSGNDVVSSRFWIYWAVTVPLTLFTLSGWAFWWNFEKNRYDIDIAETLKSAESIEEPLWWRRLSGKKETARATKEKAR